MGDVYIYHPGTGATVAVPEEALPHHRQSGWLLSSEHTANEAQAAETEAKQAKAAKTAESDTGK